MSSTQPSELSPDTKDQMDKVNSFNLSMLIGLLIITIAVLIIMSIIMNIWIKKKKSKIVPYVHEKHLPTVTSKESKTDNLLSLHLLTPPKLVFNKDTTLPVYRKTDTWDRYLKMIQSPAKLNDISPHLTTFTIAGKEVTGLIIGPLASLVVTIGATVPVQTPSIFPVCDATGCPIFTGTEYTTSGTFLLNAALPPSYQIVLTIGNLNSSSPQKLFLHNQILACAMATITISIFSETAHQCNRLWW
ncbi:19862_t:CDS:2 [Rhizophagus irregularis]|nr:19862_t:CDS:2 [Rhizophagus irregularis]